MKYAMLALALIAAPAVAQDEDSHADRPTVSEELNAMLTGDPETGELDMSMLLMSQLLIDCSYQRESPAYVGNGNQCFAICDMFPDATHALACELSVKSGILNYKEDFGEE